MRSETTVRSLGQKIVCVCDEKDVMEGGIAMERDAINNLMMKKKKKRPWNVVNAYTGGANLTFFFFWSRRMKIFSDEIFFF